MSIEQVRLRGPVPSDREREAGARIDAPATPEERTAEQPARTRRTLPQLLGEMRPSRVAQGRPLLPLLVLSASGLFAGLYDQTLGLLLPEIRADFAFDMRFLLTLGGLMSAVGLLLAPLVGYVLDRTRRVRLFRIGVLISAIAAALTGTAGGLGMLVAGRVGTGVGEAIARPATFPLLADSYPPDSRARIFSFAWMAGVLAQLVGPIAAGALAIAFGWRATVLAIGAASAIAGLGAFLMREPARGYEDRLAAGVDAEAAVVEQPPVSWSESWRAARSVTTVRRLWYASPFLQLAGAALLPTLALYYATQFGLSLQQRATILVLTGLVGVVALLLSGPVADKLLAERPGRVMIVMGIMLVAQAGVIVVLAFSRNVWLSVAVNLPLAFTSNLFAPALFTLLSTTVPARIRGLGMQTSAPWQLLGLLFLPVLGGLADDLSLRGAMLLLPPFYLIAAVILGTAAFGVDRDIRAARAADLAEETARRARAEGNRTMLVCRDVDVRYDGVQVLFGVDLDVAEGEIVALLGTNGAGKSTLLRAIAGVHEASGGAIFLGERDITHVPPHEIAGAGAVFVPGGRAIFPSLTVLENLRAAGWLRRDGDVADPEEALTFFPALRERLHEHAGNLSGGEQQMLALAQAFLMAPNLLLIDELSLGLAPAIVEQLLEILRAIHARGTTIVLVEQSVNVALTIASRAVFLEKGEVVFDGPTEELLHRGDVMRSVFLGTARTGSGLVRPAARTLPDADAAEVLLDASELRVRFGGVEALRGASLQVRAGEIVGIIGPNGAGKTTLFDAISGVIAVDEGPVRIAGVDASGLPPEGRARLGLGRSFQNARLFSTMTAREAILVAFHRHLDDENAALAAVWAGKLRRSERTLARRADGLIDLLGLGAYAGKFVGELSTATRRIVDIACCMAAEPRALLLDEPSSGLAQAETEELGPLLERLVRETGCALALIEHDIPLVRSLSDRVVAMDLGRVLVEGAPDEVVQHPEVVRAYLGTSDDVITRSGATARSRSTTRP